MEVVAEDLWCPEGPLVLLDGNLVVVEIRRQALTNIRKDGINTIIAKIAFIISPAASLTPCYFLW